MRRCSGVTLAMSVVSSPLRNLRASSPATFATPRSGKSAAFIEESCPPRVIPKMPAPELDPGWEPVFGIDHAPAKNPQRRARIGPAQEWRIRTRSGLLARNLHREFAVADAGRKPFGVFGGRVLAVGRHELAQRAEQRGLRETVAVDALETRLAPRLEQIAQCDLLLLMVGSRLPGRIDARRNCSCLKPIAAASGWRRPHAEDVSMRLCDNKARL